MYKRAISLVCITGNNLHVSTSKKD